MENISAPAAFIAGLLSFLSPCVLPLVPVYLASLAGPEILDDKADKKNAHIFLHSLSFVVGFSIVFVILGAGAGLAGLAISAHLDVIQKVAGILLIVFGGLMLLSQKVPQLNFQKRLTPSQSRTTGYLRSLATGSIFALAWTPCISYTLGGILMLAMASETARQGASLLAIYSLGLGIPFLIIGAAFDSVAPRLRRIQRHSRVIYIVSGILLGVLGILILTGRLSLLST
ncbi:MAG: sulfite exporter TauE/SafE family protein [Dehalococcoidales bacterium]|nr:sulfite exporter TauE/SafE family protein [Dehalococcoidales bacterium]